ncbi:MAG TPA: recombinase family protein [Solirubrobacterales bacterium]|nr:recombinase family protein [Solirubrobacterales bacterium]
MTTKTTAVETATSDEPLPLSKRAFVYLRVSTEEQAGTDYDRDGLSQLNQREGADGKAAELGAEVDSEFSDPGKSAFRELQKRTGFLALLEELKRRNKHEATRIHYVIVWSCSRWARNTIDHWQARELMRELGVRFISVTEPIVGEDTPAAFLYESSIVSQNQYFSMQSGENVKRGLYTKAKLGGTYGFAKTGYLNHIDRLPDGRQVRTIVLDEQRAPFLTLGFELFASGNYSISLLVEELYNLGLRTRGTRRHPGGNKVGTSTLQRILRDPYYAGWLPYKRGTAEEETFEGRHPALTDQETFDAVQALLDQKRVAHERPQKRSHYLKGSVFCRKCGSRLTFGESTGRNGLKYPYLFCASRINGTSCTMRRNIRPDLIEHELVPWYRKRATLSAEQVKRRTEALERLARVSQQAVVHVKAVKSKLIDKLKAQQARLLRLHIEEGEQISPDAFREERRRLAADIKAAEKSLAATEEQLDMDTSVLRMALELAEDVAEVFADATPVVRRGYNQAFYKHLWVWTDNDDPNSVIKPGLESELTEPFALVLAGDFETRAHQAAEAIEAMGRNATDASEEASVAVDLAAVSIFEVMAEEVGFEPTRPLARPTAS